MAKTGSIGRGERTIVGESVQGNWFVKAEMDRV